MKEFHKMRDEFHPMKLLWLGYLVYSLGNCIIKLYIETDLRPTAFRAWFKALFRPVSMHVS